MSHESKDSVKITRPTASGAIPRERLFRAIDRGLENPVVWVASPAGYGKTTLVASYLDSRGLPCIWYQCDEGDSDPASFFYYMGLALGKAVRRRDLAMPLLTPEYLQGVSSFSRRYFDRMYGLIEEFRPAGKRLILVFDNFQDIPRDSPVHELLAGGWELVPEHVRFIVATRNGPGVAYARQLANGRIHTIGRDEIRFTAEESGSLVLGRIPATSAGHVAEIYRRTEGWAAGIMLSIQGRGPSGANEGQAVDLPLDKVFDYFTGVLFEKLGEDVKDFLVRTSLLPVLDVELVERFTGQAQAGRILAELHDRNFFIERLAGDRPVYKYHSLFGEFLAGLAESRYTCQALAECRAKAALLLEEQGYIEEAARLYRDAGDAHGLARVVKRSARELLGQGRRKVVAEWMAGIPEGMLEEDAWLRYWMGMCWFPIDQPKMRFHLMRAFSMFRSAGDASGIFLAWAGTVDTYALDLDEWRSLDWCIEAFDDLLAGDVRFPTREIELTASIRMLTALILRRTEQPRLIHRWAEKVFALLEEVPSADLRLDAIFFMTIHDLWKGDYRRNALLLDEAAARFLACSPQPFAVVRIRLMQGIHNWVTGHYEDALGFLAEGLETAEKHGVHMFDSLMWSFMTAARMASGRMDAAKRPLGNQMRTAFSTGKGLDVFFLHINSAWYELLNGNPHSAAEILETVAATVEKMGNPYYTALWRLGMAQVSILLGREKEARDHVQAVQRIGARMESRVMEWSGQLLDAYCRLRSGEEAEGLRLLRSAMSLGQSNDYTHLEFYRPAVMQHLCARALDEAIEPDYVKTLIRRLNLLPPEEVGPFSLGSTLEEWPHPLKIYTLGKFEIARNGEPVVFSGKVQKKPLEMLKAIIAFGGEDVSEADLTDLLWPDADGDLARKSFETTLGRLRRLLGTDDCLRLSAGQLSIDRRRCWVDCLVLERLAKKAGAGPEDQVPALCGKAIGLYKGAFLPAETRLPWVVGRCETIRDQLLRLIVASGRHLVQERRWEMAVACYEKGLAVDALAEDIYKNIMFCLRELGDHAGVARTYLRCRDHLRAVLEIEPSPGTTAIYASIQSGRLSANE